MALSNQQLAKYLKIAYDQRSRAAKKLTEDHGAESAIAVELTRELAELNRAIGDYQLAKK